MMGLNLRSLEAQTKIVSVIYLMHGQWKSHCTVLDYLEILFQHLYDNELQKSSQQDYRTVNESLCHDEET